MCETALKFVLTPDWLRGSSYLAGVELVFDDGSPFPDSQLQHDIDAAIQTLSGELDLVLVPREVRGERDLDYAAEEGTNYHTMILNQAPVWSVNSWCRMHGNQKIETLPVDWLVQRDWALGEMQVFPAGSSSSAQYGGSYGVWGAYGGGGTLWDRGAGYIPGMFSVDYTAGFPSACGSFSLDDSMLAGGPGGSYSVDLTFDKAFPSVGVPYEVYVKVYDQVNELVATLGAEDSLKTHEGFRLTLTDLGDFDSGEHRVEWVALTIPENFLAAIGMGAALGSLNVAGDLILGAGIANQSISADGLSQSIGSTASATNAGYGARVRQLERQRTALLKTISSQWRRRSLFAF